jgi:hypothetical protein
MGAYDLARKIVAFAIKQSDITLINPTTHEIHQVRGFKSDKSIVINPEITRRAGGRCSHISISEESMPEGMGKDWIVQFDSKTYKVAMPMPNSTTGLKVFIVIDADYTPPVVP